VMAGAIAPKWIVVAAENGKPDMTHLLAIAIRRAIGDAAAAGLLSLDGDGHQHCKPDGILICSRTHDVYIYDVTTASDHLLAEEVAFVAKLRAAGYKIRDLAKNRALFDCDGRITEGGLDLIDVEEHGDVSRIITFTQMRYRIRYSMLAKVIQRTLRAHRAGRPAVHVMTIAVGTGGHIPADTRFALRRVVDSSAPALKAVVASLMDVTHRLAVQVYGAWREEQDAHDAAMADAAQEAFMDDS
jgi:hypothetical protein